LFQGLYELNFDPKSPNWFQMLSELNFDPELPNFVTNRAAAHLRAVQAAQERLVIGTTKQKQCFRLGMRFLIHCEQAATQNEARYPPRDFHVSSPVLVFGELRAAIIPP
jgi:hypothetical protein